MSFYRKYRPKDFPSLVGQEHIRVTLLNAVKARQISHAYLFTGPRGTGKTTTARLLAKAINAEVMTEDGRFDGSEIAEEIDAGRLIDVIEIDAASNRGIDEIRDLREKINYSPTRAKNKVYIIDEVHMLTKEAFNALLKTLEEPPSFVFFILATTEVNKVPETIISRCQRFDFRRITEEDLLSRLKYVAEAEGILAEEEALKIVAKQARGGLRDALSLFEQLISGKKLEAERVKKVLGISNYTACEELFVMMENGQAAEGMAKLEQIFQAGVDLVQFNRDFLDYLRQKMLLAVKNSEESKARHLIELLSYFQEAYEKQKFSYIPELPLEVAIAKACLKKNELGNKAESEASLDSVGSKKKPDVVKTEPKVVISTAKAVSEVPATSTKLPEASPTQEMPKAEEKTEQPNMVGELNLENLLSKWTKVFDRIHNPLAKRCLMMGKPVEINGANIVLAFSSNFNKDKLFVPELLAVSEEAIAAEYGMAMKLTGKIDPALVPTIVTMNSNQQNENPKPEIVTSAPTANVLESAMNVFGGEVSG